MHDLFALEKQRQQATQRREQVAQARQRAHTQTLDDQLSAERRLASEARPSGSTAWRGVGDYEVDLLKAEHARAMAALEHELETLRRYVAQHERAAEEHAQNRAHIDVATAALQRRVTELEAQLADYDARTAALRDAAATAEARVAKLEAQLADADAVRRQLHNQVQDLRGNVRVYARVRPPRDDGAVMELRYPDRRLATQLEVLAPTESATGAVTVKTHHFTFDRVFPPSATQADVFDEVSDLMQSVLDGYHVRTLLFFFDTDDDLCLWPDGLRQDAYHGGR